MDRSTIFILWFIFCIFGCFFCPHWIKTAQDSRDKSRGLFSFIMCVFMLMGSGWGIIYENNLLWYGQHKENAYIKMDINFQEVENSSFIYLLEKFDANTTVTDVTAIMGNQFEESDVLGYEMEYMHSRHTINDSEATSVTFIFNRRKTKILSIKWAYKAPKPEMFSQTLNYLENNAFGKANSSSWNKADWKGLHLEDTEYYLLLSREF